MICHVSPSPASPSPPPAPPSLAVHRLCDPRAGLPQDASADAASQGEAGGMGGGHARGGGGGPASMEKDIRVAVGRVPLYTLESCKVPYVCVCACIRMYTIVHKKKTIHTHTPVAVECRSSLSNPAKCHIYDVYTTCTILYV